MFAIPGFNVGNLVVEAPKEQLKKRKHDTITDIPTPTSTVKATATTAAATTTTTVTTTPTTTTTTTSSSSSLTIAPSTSNAPFSKKFKKEPVYEKRPPSEPKLGWGWIPEPVPLKERASWNRPTKALRKAKAEEEKAKKEKAIEDKKRVVSSISGPGAAVELLLQGSVDMTDIAGLGGNKAKGDKAKDGDDVVMTDAAAKQESKKRNKRLERKIKRAAYIAALESTTTTVAGDEASGESNSATVETPEDATEKVSEEVEDGESSEKPKKKAKPAPAPVHPELAKLTNKEKRLLKQFQKKQLQDGVDLTAIASPELLKPAPKKPHVEDKKPETTANLESKKENKKENKKEKKEKTTVAEAAAAVTQEKGAKANKKNDSELSKKQQQLAKEREKLLEALNRTNSALAELQTSLGDGDEDGSPLSKEDVKSAVQDKKKNKKEKKEKAAAPTPAPVVAKPATTPATQQKQPKLTKLQEQMKKTLAGGKFRFLNEQLYTTTGEEAFELFQSKPELFDEYHEGFRSQVELWPQNPVDIFIAELKKMPKDTVVADLGCGDAQISQELSKQYKNILSFDLVAKNERVTACDIAHLPLEDSSVDVAIFCLSLMGTDFLKFLKEARRVLKTNGQLKIAEVISRFTDVDAFVSALKALGFELKHSDSSNKMFILFDFIKPDSNLASSSKKNKKGSKKQKVAEETDDVDLEELDGPSLLKPCIYKKR
ncbi:25S rRNA (adenine645-N1)-methyltransferase [Haplosporangium sp. Z 27]|nr:25S rRNA (adenine645-N1)-methyltransferase [Haplosporangium sp. Z 27]